ncbi:MAG: DUF6452 family protein [Thiohalospira sp.]
MRIVKRILFFVLIAGIFACSDDQCHLDTDTFLKVEMSVDDPDLPKAFIDSLSVYAPEWADSIYYKNEGQNKSLWLMLSPNEDSSTFIFTSNLVEDKDTITFFYQRDFVFLSPECGFVGNFAIDSVQNTFNNIDSLALEKNLITTNEQGLLKIFF